jgi:hypothetical protein
MKKIQGSVLVRLAKCLISGGLAGIALGAASGNVATPLFGMLYGSLFGLVAGILFGPFLLLVEPISIFRVFLLAGAMTVPGSIVLAAVLFLGLRLSFALACVLTVALSSVLCFAQFWRLAKNENDLSAFRFEYWFGVVVWLLAVAVPLSFLM